MSRSGMGLLRVGDVVLKPVPDAAARKMGTGIVQAYTAHRAGVQLGLVYMTEATPRWTALPDDVSIRGTVCRTRAEACAYLSQPTNGH